MSTISSPSASSMASDTTTDASSVTSSSSYEEDQDAPRTTIGYVIPRTNKNPSPFLLHWLQHDEYHGYEFNEDVLFGREPDSDWLGGFINQPNNWDEVAKCLRSEITGQERLARSKTFKHKVNVWYWRGCKQALEEVEDYYI